jgi:hypothetical protein
MDLSAFALVGVDWCCGTGGIGCDLGDHSGLHVTHSRDAPERQVFSTDLVVGENPLPTPLRFTIPFNASKVIGQQHVDGVASRRSRSSGVFHFQAGDQLAYSALPPC